MDVNEIMEFEDDGIGSQENTEPLADSGFNSQSQDESQSQSQSQTHYWGRLYPLKAALQVIDLVQNSVTLGKGIDADVIIKSNELPEEVYKKFSKLHFTIQRRSDLHVGSSVTKVFIIDRSSNGTYINGRYLHKDPKTGSLKRRELKSNDIIGLPCGKRTPHDAYLFIDTLVSPTNTIPKIVRNKYEITLRLGIGAFGEVSLVFDKIKGIPYAMKTIVKDTNVKRKVIDYHKEKLLNELRILQAVNHPNVIKLMDVIDCEREHFLFLEYMEGRDLSDRIQKNEKFDEDLAKFYVYQIANGVKYLHKIGITHRDLKPANILLLSSDRETLLKITDFGLSKVLSPATMMKTLCGTKLFVAPEVLFGGGMFKYTEQVDVWSLGVIMYLCLSGTEPFSSSSETSVEELIKEAAFTMPSNLWGSVSLTAQSLIRKMLTREPHDRITSSQILDDPWLEDPLMLEKVKKLYQEITAHPEMAAVNSNYPPSFCRSQDRSSLICHGMSPPCKRFKPTN